MPLLEVQGKIDSSEEVVVLVVIHDAFAGSLLNRVG